MSSSSRSRDSSARTCKGIGRKGCSRILSEWDDHENCPSCVWIVAGIAACTRTSTCSVCEQWDEAKWLRDDARVARRAVDKGKRAAETLAKAKNW